jgi:CubicO group peptidase (beta-lactamase class C family)
MDRRTFIKVGLGTALAGPLAAAAQEGKFDAAADVLAKAVSEGQVRAASIYVRHGKTEFARPFGLARSTDAMFLLASITKTMTSAALMTLYDRGAFRLEDPVAKFIPEFSKEARARITIAQILTHVSGLPDQLPENHALRKRHAKLSEFVEGAIRTPLLFEPGARYSYSSMGILLASEVARRITGTDFATFIDGAVFGPLEMARSALGLGRFKIEELMRCQAEGAAPESGSGDPSAKEWDWNSSYWRELGVPWGTAHGSAPDVGRFLAEFLHPTGRMMKPETARLMVRNHNPAGFTPRGLGFGVGTQAGSPGCSERTFGHTGSAGTLMWADPAKDAICVVLTTLPALAAARHPRKAASDLVAQAVS